MDSIPNPLAEATVGGSTLDAGFVTVASRFAPTLTTSHERWFELERGELDEFTRDIPNVGEEALQHLDDAGVARVGTGVTPGMLLIGRVTKREGAPLSPEEKLLRAIFGEKAGDVTDTSRRVPPWTFATVGAVELLPDAAAPQKVRVQLTWTRPLEVGDVLDLDGHQAVVCAVAELSTGDLACSGVAPGARVKVKKVVLARDVLHARSIGPYDLFSQQPLSERASWGGQRASTALVTGLATRAPWVAWELLTIKADVVSARARLYEGIVKRENPGTEYLEPPTEAEPEPVAPAPPPATPPAPPAGGLKDIFSFFDKPKRGFEQPEVVRLIGAWLRAMGLEVNLTGERVALTMSTDDTTRTHAHGQVRTADDLDSQKLFGPKNDYQCECGKYQRMKHRGVVCEKCGVEVVQSRVRRERFAFLELDAAVLHPFDPTRSVKVLPVMPAGLRPGASSLTPLYARALEAKGRAACEQVVNELFDELCARVDNVWSKYTFTKAVDYSGVAQLVVDESLPPGTCRLPRELANELFKPFVYGLLEAKGFATTIKGAKKMLEGLKPEALRCVEVVGAGYPVVLASETHVLARTVLVWDHPALAVDAATARSLGAKSAQVFVPMTSQAVLECLPLEEFSLTTDAPPAPGQGWLARARRSGELVKELLDSGGRADVLEDPVVRLALGRWPPAPDEAALRTWDEARRRHEADAQVSTPREPQADGSAPINEHLARSVDELEVSVATYAAFQALELKTIGDLVQKTEADLLKTRNFGRKSLKEVKELLAELGLSLGMRL